MVQNKIAFILWVVFILLSITAGVIAIDKGPMFALWFHIGFISCLGMVLSAGLWHLSE